MAYHLASPKGIAEPVDLGDLAGWFVKEQRRRVYCRQLERP
jgi:hypothetical protein